MTGPTTIDDALHLLPAPVAIVGVARDGEMGGLTAAWLSRVSLDPPLLMVAVGHQRYTWKMLEGADEFTVSLLSEGQVDEARLFGLQSRRDVDKWARVDHVLLGTGTPALAACCVRFLCRLAGRVPAGDHDAVLGEVVMAERISDLDPLPLRGSDYTTGT